MEYLLDSNVCIGIINKRLSARAQQIVDIEIAHGAKFLVSSIVLHELWYGVAKSHKKQANEHNIQRFLRVPFEPLGFDAEDARKAGEIRGDLTLRGTPIGPYDVLIAGQALARDLTLVTANTREFSRVPGLKLVDWS
jgi:tRNA(fMet)-specific endonuclease VapC